MASVLQKIGFYATFNSKKKYFNCEQHKAFEVVATYFGINMRDGDVTLYSVKKNKRLRIAPDAIDNGMDVEIVSSTPRTTEAALENKAAVKAALENIASKQMLESIVTKLRHNTPLNGNERKALIEALQTHSTSIFKKKLKHTGEKQNKKVQVFIYGKDSFTQTEDIPSLNDVEKPLNDVENARNKLKRWWNQNKKPNEEVDLLMKDTFVERRKNILLESAPVKIIKEQFPFLFCVEQVKNELDRIFYPGKSLEFLENMKKYAEHILHYKDDADKVKEVYDIIAKARERAKTPAQKAYAEEVGSVFLLAKLLDEEFGFIHLSDYAHSSTDLYPYIDASLYSLNRIFFDDILFHIKVEGEELCEASNFSEAVLCLMATFFIFNIDYPAKCRCTLTVIEKVFLEANDTMEMEGKTEQWIKLLTMREKKSKTQPSKPVIPSPSKSFQPRESRSKKNFFM